MFQKLFDVLLVTPVTKNEHFSMKEIWKQYESIATVGEIRVWWRADFQSGSRVLKKVF